MSTLSTHKDFVILNDVTRSTRMPGILTLLDGPKLFDTLIVFLKEVLKKLILKNQQTTTKA